MRRREELVRYARITSDDLAPLKVLVLLIDAGGFRHLFYVRVVEFFRIGGRVDGPARLR